MNLSVISKVKLCTRPAPSFRACPRLALLPGRRHWQVATCRVTSVLNSELTAAQASLAFVEEPPLPHGCVTQRWQAQILRPSP